MFPRNYKKLSKIKRFILKILNVYALDKESLNLLNPDYKISFKNEKFFIRQFKKNFPEIDINTYYFFKKIHFLKWICVIIGYIYKDNKINNDYFYKAQWYYHKFKNRHLNINIEYNIKNN